MNLNLKYSVPVFLVLIAFAIGITIYFEVFQKGSNGELEKTQWKGINSYYLWACEDDYQDYVFGLMKSYNYSVIRVFILGTNDEGYPGECGFFPDVEQPVGVFQMQTVDRLNKFLARAIGQNLTVILALHDRWSLGCWRRDAYTIKYNLSWTGSCNTLTNDPSVFYQNLDAMQDFRNRLSFLMNVENPYLNNTQWKNLSLIVDIENEYQYGAPFSANHQWFCQMAVFLKSIAPKIQITNGGGGFGLNVLNAGDVLNCAAVDLITFHDYNVSPISNLFFYYYSQLKNKPVVLEEFGSSFLSDLKQHVELAELYRYNWLVWNIDHMNNSLSLWDLSDPKFLFLNGQ